MAVKIKRCVKTLLGRIRCVINGITCPGGVYIGRNVHFTSGKKIKLGKNVSIRPECDLFAGERFQIGDNCDIGTRNRIAGNIVIEDSVLFGPDNFVCSHTHTFDDINIPIMYQKEHEEHKNGHTELKIGEGSWIGTHVAIIGDVHIGEHCVIGANSVVTKDIPAYSIAVGSPAKVVRQYSQEKGEWIKYEDKKCTN